MNCPFIHHPFRPLAIALFNLGLLGHSLAATTIVTMNVNAAIPDDDSSGIASTIVVSTPIQSVEAITLILNIGNEFAMWNGDYYAYLVHDSGFVVLLNRTGRTATNSDGYGDPGFAITLDDLASGDIHLYQDILDPAGGILTGDWQPDRRLIDPASSLDSSPRGSALSAFNGMNPNGNWTLFVTDTVAGGEGRLVDWTLTIKGQIPEPGTSLLLAGGFLFTFFRRRRSTTPLPHS